MESGTSIYTYLVCTPPVISNAQVTSTNTIVKIGGKFDFECDENFSLDGSEQRDFVLYCKQSQVFSGTPNGPRLRRLPACASSKFISSCIITPSWQ